MMRRFLRLAAARPMRTAFVQPTHYRPFIAARSLRLKEDTEHDPHEIDAKKHEQIEKQKKGEGHWHEELASNSESHIAADKENIEDHDEHMEDLQKETAGKHQEEHPDGKA